MTLSSLLAGRADIWRGNELPVSVPGGEPTGYPALDRLLGGGGWPRRAVTELLSASAGDGALELVLPALARLSEQGRWIALVAPPFAPFAPGFSGQGVRLDRLLWLRPLAESERLWSMEQALQSGACAAVLAWPGERMARQSVRRLQLAAETGNALGFLFLVPALAGNSSAAALRLCAQRRHGGLEVEILKRRGGWALPPRPVSRT